MNINDRGRKPKTKKIDIYRESDVIQFKGSKQYNLKDKVVFDSELIIKIDNKLVGKLICLPNDIEFLGWGFLLTGGWIKSIEDVKSFNLKGNMLKVELSSKKKAELSSILLGCGKEIIFKSQNSSEINQIKKNKKNPKGLISPQDIINIMKQFQKADIVHKETGGTHSAGIGYKNELLFSISDVSRHSAIQKVIGKIFLEKIPAEDKIVVTTGRISSDMVLACAEISISTIISKSAPIFSAIERAKEKEITLIGFVRGERLTCFSGCERIG